MLFNSYEFLFLFLPVVLAGYYALPARRSRHVWLTISSYVFYGWWDYRFCALMLASTLIDFFAAPRIERAETSTGRRGWLAVSLVGNLSLLGFFKYFDMFAETANRLALAMGGSSSAVPLLHIILPVGISFYTFQSMSYTIDVYRRAVKPTRSLVDFACYVSLFPQLVAGPIVRYSELAEQLVSRSHSFEKAALGLRFFIMGLAKKVLLADGAATLVPLAFDTAHPGLTQAWAGVLGYTAQIYFDFSGYSDMAVGLGYLFGFTFPQNFNSPYKAVSITDFWRRWHISLSSWLRDYLYVSLGGNRNGAGRTYANLFVTMLLGGLWHGASWTFVVWGAYHGALLALERMAGKKGLAAGLPRIGQQALAFLLVMLGWVLFRAVTLAQAGDVLAGMAGLNGWGAEPFAWLPSHLLGVVVLALSMSLAWGAPNTWALPRRVGLRTAMVLCVLFALCVAVMLVNASSPFLYFQF